MGINLLVIQRIPTFILSSSVLSDEVEGGVIGISYVVVVNKRFDIWTLTSIHGYCNDYQEGYTMVDMGILIYGLVRGNQVKQTPGRCVCNPLSSR